MEYRAAHEEARWEVPGRGVRLGLSSENENLHEIETVNRWIEFERIGDTVFVHVAVDDSCQNNHLITTERYPFSYMDPLNFTLPYHELKYEILETSERFLAELEQINPCLGRTKIVSTLKQKIDTIRN